MISCWVEPLGPADAAASLTALLDCDSGIGGPADSTGGGGGGGPKLARRLDSEPADATASLLGSWTDGGVHGGRRSGCSGRPG